MNRRLPACNPNVIKMLPLAPVLLAFCAPM